MSNADDALAAAAEAEAAEAEALAAAARARAQAIRLRREAAAMESSPSESAPAETAAQATPADEVEAAAVEPDDATVVTEATEGPFAETRGRPSGALVVMVVAASVAILVALGLLGLGTSMYLDHRSRETQRQHAAEFAAGARQGVVTLMSLDFSKAAEDAQRIIDNTTGDFKKDFERQAKEFVKVAQESKVVTEANVNAVAVQSMTKNTATVLVAVATNVSNKASSQQAPRSWRLSVDVARDGDQMKLSKVEFVQ